MSFPDPNNRGFTLIELIIFIVVASIVGTALFNFSMSSQHVVTPRAMLSTRLNLQTAMETIVYDYKIRLSTDSLDLAEFKNHAETVNLPGVSGVSVTATLETGTLQDDDPRILEIVVSKQGQSLWAFFTE